MMDGVGAKFTQKFGPLPVWAWGAILLAVVGLGYWLKERSANASAATTTDTSGQGASASDASSYDNSASDYAGDGSSTGIGAGANTGGAITQPSSTGPANNQAWMAQATSYLIGFGYTGAQVSQALNNWLLGNQATPQDTALYNLAVSQFGLPPEGVPPQPTNTDVGVPGGDNTQPNGTPAPSSGGTPALTKPTSAPTNVKVTGTTATTTTIGFDEVPGAVYYEAYMGGTRVASSAQPPLTIGGLGAGKSHVFTIAGVGVNGRGPISAPITATTTKA